MGCNNRCSSYFTNLSSAARQNRQEKYTVVKGDYLKVNVMCVPMCGEVGVEVHEGEDQLITVVCGNATVKLGNTRCAADCVKHLSAGESVFVPAGTWHNVCNTGNGRLKLISTYGYGNNNCGYTQNGVSGCGNVFHTGNDNRNDMQTQDNGCNCGIDSGC